MQPRVCYFFHLDSSYLRQAEPQIGSLKDEHTTHVSFGECTERGKSHFALTRSHLVQLARPVHHEK